jgi:hypothetical protein
MKNPRKGLIHVLRIFWLSGPRHTIFDTLLADSFTALPERVRLPFQFRFLIEFFDFRIPA